MLRGRFACFPAPWSTSNHNRHDDGEEDEEGRASVVGVGVSEPSSASFGGGAARCVRWTLRGRALRERRQALDCMLRELDQHAGSSTGAPPPALVVSTEAMAFLLSPVQQKGRDPVVARLLDFCGRVAAVRVVELDRHRSHVCDLSLFAALETLELVGVAPSFLAPAGLMVVKARVRSLTFQRSALCHLDELLLLPLSQSSAPWAALERLIIRDCETLDLAPATALTLLHRCPKLTELAAPRNRLRSLRALVRSRSKAGAGAAEEEGEACCSLRVLDLSRNAIRSAACLLRPRPPLPPLVAGLQALNLAHNTLRSTKGLEALVSLRRLDLAHNLIGDWADVERLEQLAGLEALALEGNPLAAAPASEREYRIRVFALLRPPPRVRAAQWGEAEAGDDGSNSPAVASLPLLLDGRAMDAGEAAELTRRMGPVYVVPVLSIISKPAAAPQPDAAVEGGEEEEEEATPSVSVGTGSPGTVGEGPGPGAAAPGASASAASTLVLEGLEAAPQVPADTIAPPPAMGMPPAPASPSSVSSAGSSSLRASSVVSGGGRRSRSATPTGMSKTSRTVKGADGRARRVAMIEEEGGGGGGGDAQQEHERPGSSGLEGESLEVALDRCLAERHSEPALLPPAGSRAKKKGKEKGKKRRSASVAAPSTEGLGEVEGRLSAMREELQALEARLAAARAEVAAVEEAKLVAQQAQAQAGAAGAVPVASAGEPEQLERPEGPDLQEREGAGPGAEEEGAEEEEEEEDEEEEAELVQLNLRESALGSEEAEGLDLPAEDEADDGVGQDATVGEEEEEQQQQQEEPAPTAESEVPPAGADGKEETGPPEEEGSATGAAVAAPTAASTSGNNMRRFLSLADLDSLRAFLLDHQVFGSITGATSSLRQAFEIDPARSVFHSLALPRPEKLLHLYKERVLADAWRKSGRYQDLLPVETTVLLAVTDRHLYVIDPAFAAPNPSGHMKHFSEAPPPLLLARHPLRALDRVVVGFKGQWGRLEFDVTEEAAAASAASTPIPSQQPRAMRQGLSPSPTLSAFGDAQEGDGDDEEDTGSCRLLQEEGSVPGDPVVGVGYTLVTRSKAQTFRILNAELRPLANEARLGRGGAGAAPGRLSGSSGAALMRERALSASSGGGSSLGKVAIVNAEEEALAALEGVGGLRYYEMVYQWSRKRSQLLPRTVMVTEEGELIVAVEDLRQDPTLPLPLAPDPGLLSRPGSDSSFSANAAEIERGGSADSHSQRSSFGGLRGTATDKFSPVPVAGERTTVLLRAPLADVVDAAEEARDPRYITLTVREPSALFFKRAHTWRLYSENRRKIDALLKLLRDSIGASSSS